MGEKENIRFFTLLTENESTRREFSPFKYGISGKSARKIFNAFSVIPLGKTLTIQRHENINSEFFRIKTDYLINQKPKTYCLTVEIQKNEKSETNNLKSQLKEYFYLKLILHILFKENRFSISYLLSRN